MASAPDPATAPVATSRASRALQAWRTSVLRELHLPAEERFTHRAARGDIGVACAQALAKRASA
ncbi:MAG: hypothetical protein JO362_17210 [Streptomycetaceae bacterium]|nr:hypothetical protein [Streptomycetaceae bacterium]